ncbi:MAG: hypothetical protein JJU00_15925 [Opitutales bacterium]|nr:hypothetical protein [Opitutales bacterium]
MTASNAMDQPLAEVQRAFGSKGVPVRLKGGEGRCFRVANCVFKPVENVTLHEWSARLLERLQANGFRISRPMRSARDGFVYKGWAASSYEPGQHFDGNWTEKLKVGRLFHQAINALALDPIPARDDRWARSHDIVWGRGELPDGMDPVVLGAIDSIVSRFGESDCAEQIIHSDLCGNILFEKGLAPLIIDFSPAVGPLAYGEAILVADAIAWEGASTELIDSLPMTEFYRQMLYRAVAFRIVVAGLFFAKEIDRFRDEHRAFLPIIEYLDGSGSQQNGRGSE